LLLPSEMYLCEEIFGQTRVTLKEETFAKVYSREKF